MFPSPHFTLSPLHIYAPRAAALILTTHINTPWLGSCNQYNLKDYLPVYVGQELVGYAHHDFVSELTLVQQGTMIGHMCHWLTDRWIGRQQG